jgi:PAS domain S-box-containing protein
VGVTPAPAKHPDDASRIVLWTHGAEQLYGYTKAEALGQVSHTLLGTIFPEPLEHIEATLAQTGRWSGKFFIHQTRAGQTIVVASQWLLERDGDGQPRRIIEANADITALEQATARLNILAEASRTFAAAGLDAPALLEKVASFIGTQLTAGCVIRLLSDDRAWLEAITVYDSDPSLQAAAEAIFQEERIPIDSANPAAVALRSGRSQLLAQIDLASLRATLTPALWQFFKRLQPHSGVIIPLQVHGHPIGILSFTRHDPAQPPFTVDDLHLAEDLANRAVLAIGNARLFAQAQQEIAAREQAEVALIAEHARVIQLKNEFMTTMSYELRTPLHALLGQTQLLEMGIHGELNERQTKALQTVERSGQHLLALINDILDYARFEAGHVSLDITATAVAPLCQEALRLIAPQALAKQIMLTTTLDSSVTSVPADSRRLLQILVNLLSNAVKFTPNGGWERDVVAATPAPTLPPATVPRAVSHDGQAPLILIVEDNEANITVLQDALSAQGYAFAVAHDGVAALERARAAPPALILMDIQMPGMDGLEAIQRIRADADLRTIPIVALTALAMPGDRERCLAAGADDYLTKPIDLRTLVATIDA